MEMPSISMPKSLVAAVVEVDWKTQAWTKSKTSTAEEALCEAAPGGPGPRKSEKFFWKEIWKYAITILASI